MNFAFDVDGTLTPSRQPIDETFKWWFLQWCYGRTVYLVTGSDFAKTLEQVGPDIVNAVTAVYNCAGNAIYVKGNLVYRSDFVISDELRAFLNQCLVENPYSVRTGNHIEERVGLCNFSIVGRGADHEQRQHYVKYDQENFDREHLARMINTRFPEVDAQIGGETGIDIFANGKDKSQIADCIEPFVFFGDAIYPGGNDYTVAQRAVEHHHVKDWQHTRQILQERYEK